MYARECYVVSVCGKERESASDTLRVCAGRREREKERKREKERERERKRERE